MPEACRALHGMARNARRHSFPFDSASVPANGIDLLFEKGEVAHGGDRIVRVGTHTGQNQLPNRLIEHFLKPNKDRSIFRKNIGRALLNREEDDFLAHWNLDLTSRSSRDRYEDLVDHHKQADVERKVTEYIQSSFSFTVLEVPDRTERSALARGLIGTVASCAECRPSESWLGYDSPKPKIRDAGLWQEQHIGAAPLSAAHIESLDDRLS